MHQHSSSYSRSISENSFSDQDSLASLNYTLYENEGKTILASDKINLLQGKKMRFMDRHESPLSSSSRMIYICDGFPRFSLLPPSDFETFFFVNRKILSIRNITYKEIVFTWLFCEKKNTYILLVLASTVFRFMRLSILHQNFV